MKNRVVFLGSGVFLLLAACDQGQNQVSEVPAPAFSVAVEETGCVVEQITSEPFEQYQFQGVSPDGTEVVYTWVKGQDEDGNDIRGSALLNLETGETVQLPDRINNGGTFSPNGQMITGARYLPEGRTEIYLLDRQTGEFVDIAPDPQWDFLASFSPDGTSILFNSHRSGDNELYLFNLETRTLRRLTEKEGYDAHGEFSPDGTKVLYHHMVERRDDEGFDFDLYAIDLATLGETRLTDSPFEESYGSWSPDGAKIVFSSDFEENPEKHNLYILNLETGEKTPLTKGNWKDSYSFWHRSGNYIYFNSDRDGSTNIYRMPMIGSDCKRET